MEEKHKPRKILQFNLSPKEYSDFWYIASLLNLDKKNAVLIKMMDIVKELKEKVDKE